MSYGYTLDNTRTRATLHDGGDYTSASDALLALVTLGIRSVAFAPGAYVFTAGVEMNATVSVELLGGAILIPATTGSVGLFSFTGGVDCGVYGEGGIRIPQPSTTEAQTHILFTNCTRPFVRGIRTDVREEGSNSFPHNIIKLDTCTHPAIDETITYPNRGTRWLYATECYGGHWNNNIISNEIGTDLTDYTPRECYEIFRAFGWGWHTAIGNRAIGIGDAGNTNILNAGFVLENSLDGGAEQGHVLWANWHVEAVHVRRTVEWIAVRHGTIRQCEFGYNPSITSFDLGSNLDSVILLRQASDGTKCIEPHIHGCKFHNTNHDGAPAIFSASASDLEISECTFALTEDGPPIVINQGIGGAFQSTGTNVRGKIVNNTFLAAYATAPTHPVSFVRIGQFLANGPFIVKNNTSFGYSTGWTGAAVEPLGMTGPVYFTGHPFDTTLTIGPSTSIDIQSIATSAGSDPRLIATSGTPFSSLVAGDRIHLKATNGGGTVINQRNNGYMLVKAVNGGGANIDLEVNTFFTDFLDEAGSTITINVFSRMANTNLNAPLQFGP